MSPAYTYDKLDQPNVLKHLFQPPSSSAPSAPENCEEMMIKNGDNGELHLRAFESKKKDNAVILFFHHGDEQVSDYNEIAELFNRKAGVSFLVAEYRGYGLATGTPSVTAMMSDSQLLFERALQWKEDNDYTGKLLIMGLKLGCVCAIDLAHQNPKQIDALLIDSGFADSIPALQAMGVDTEALGLSEKDCFHNLDKIRELTMALYVIHMAKDDFIHVDNATTLVSEALSQQRELQIVPGKTETSIFDVAGTMYYDVLNRFIKKIGIVRKKKVGVR